MLSGRNHEIKTEDFYFSFFKVLAYLKRLKWKNVLLPKTVDGGERKAYERKGFLRTYWMWVWVGPSAGLNILAERKQGCSIRGKLSIVGPFGSLDIFYIHILQ